MRQGGRESGSERQGGGRRRKEGESGSAPHSQEQGTTHRDRYRQWVHTVWGRGERGGEREGATLTVDSQHDFFR